MSLEIQDLSRLTPMMRQYTELKREARDAVLFFRMGDFYEIFGEDALEVAPRLELTLTSRERGDEQRIPFCGVPHHSAKNYWLRLLRQGFKVALADQMEDPELAKGLVKREITRIFTPGCVDDPEALDADTPNYLAALYEHPKTREWSIALADVSTGELRAGTVADVKEGLAFIQRLRPREVLVRRFAKDFFEKELDAYLIREKAVLGELPEGCLRDEEAQTKILENLFGAKLLDHQPCGPLLPGLKAALAGLLSYVESLRCATSQFLRVLPLQEPRTMQLDEVAIRDLELFETVRRRGSEGSLYAAINATLSPMGARLLRQSLLRPFLDHEPVALRQGAIEELLAAPQGTLETIRTELKGLPDLERLMTRVLSRGASPLELARVRMALTKCRTLAAMGKKQGLVGKTFHGLFAALKKAEAACTLLEKTLVAEPGSLGGVLNVFLPGHDAKLDEKTELSRSGEKRLEEYEAKEREKTGITSLKVKNHKSFGLLIEITKSNLTKVPAHYVRRQTMVNCERYVTEELNRLAEALLSATSEAHAREAELYQDLLQKLAVHHATLKDVAQTLGLLDLLQSFTWQARELGYVRPRLAKDGALILKGSRHPVVEGFVGRHQFIPNDLEVPARARQLVITGPNMAGKSTIMRQTAICAILHQIGSFVPAAEATLPMFDRVFTRVGAADDLSRGQSTFMVEMCEAAQILRQASDRSLVILDEVGRGTSTQDGMALAGAILEELSKRVGCTCLFATHYHEILPFARKLSGVRTAQTEVVEKDDGIVFTHRLIPGECSSSFGIEVARLAGVPKGVIDRARDLVTEFSRGEEPREKRPTRPPLEDFGLLVDEVRHERLDPVFRKTLDELKPLETTPLQAFNILNDLKSLWDGAGAKSHS